MPARLRMSMSVSPRRTVICSVNQARVDSTALARRACPADSASRDRPRGSPASMIGSLAALRASAPSASSSAGRAVMRHIGTVRRHRVGSALRCVRGVVGWMSCRPCQASSRIARLAHQEGAEHAGTEADGECQGRGRGQQLAARHSEDGRAEQALFTRLGVVFRPARQSGDHWRHKNALLVKKCQQSLSLELKILQLRLMSGIRP